MTSKGMDCNQLKLVKQYIGSVANREQLELIEEYVATVKAVRVNDAKLRAFDSVLWREV